MSSAILGGSNAFTLSPKLSSQPHEPFPVYWTEKTVKDLDANV